MVTMFLTDSKAQIIEEWTEGDYTIPGVYWNITELTTRNNVTVTMYSGGG